MDNETWILIDKIGIVFSILLMALAILGEALGWWADLGLLLGAASLAAGFFSSLDLNGRRLLTRFSVQEHRMDRMLGNQEAMLGNQEAMLGNQEKMVRALDRIVEILDERLPAS